MISREKDYNKFYTKLTCSCFGCSTFVRQPPSWTCGLWKRRPQSSTYRDGDRKRPSCFWRQTFVGSILGQSKTWKKKYIKNSWNWPIIIMPATVWRILNVKECNHRKRLKVSLKKKTRKITSSKIILEMKGLPIFWSLSKKNVILYPSAIDNFRGLIKPTCIRDEN